MSWRHGVGVDGIHNAVLTEAELGLLRSAAESGAFLARKFSLRVPSSAALLDTIEREFHR